jgi:hypothetical protein
LNEPPQEDGAGQHVDHCRRIGARWKVAALDRAPRDGLCVVPPGGHDSMLTRPDEVTEALLKI